MIVGEGIGIGVLAGSNVSEGIGVYVNEGLIGVGLCWARVWESVGTGNISVKTGFDREVQEKRIKQRPIASNLGFGMFFTNIYQFLRNQVGQISLHFAVHIALTFRA